MIKAVLFDLDDTLIDFMRFKKACCLEAVEAMVAAGLPMGKRKALKVLFELYGEYGIEYSRIFQKFLRKAMGRIDWGILAAGVVAYRRVRAGFLHPYPKVVPTLIKLKEKGFKLGIVSDAPRIKAWIRLASMGISDYFDFVITKDDVKGKLKPHSLPFREAVKKLGLKPEEIMFVGDNPQRDITGANRAGMVSVWVNRGRMKKGKVKPDFEVRDIRGILKCIS